MLYYAPSTPWSQDKQFPEVEKTAYIFPTATLIGAVHIEDEVFVGPNAIIRADEGMPIYIGEKTNIQDAVIIHGLKRKTITNGEKEYSVYIAAHVSCAHGSIIHGPSHIGEDTFIGFNVVIHDASIGAHSYIGHGAQVVGVTVPQGRYVDHGQSVTTQEGADALPLVPEDLQSFNQSIVDTNVLLTRGYKKIEVEG